MDRSIMPDGYRGLIKSWAGKLRQLQYPLLILALGVVLMLLPQKSETAPDVSTPIFETGEDDLEQRLTELLQAVDGAGQVAVMLTKASGTTTEYQQDIERLETQERTELRQETVLLDDQPIAVKTTYPVYQGAVIVCQGADRASVRLDIIRAVSSLTGLGSDKIIVIKMKG